MIINTNIGSINAQRNLMTTNTAMQKSLEKLSSGFRINRAADDAAGLAISEKMRGQVSGLKQAIRNAQSAISLIQTAEGALNETHSILQRMRELAVQSSSSTNTADDRAKIQSEMDQLAQEMSRISNTTEFNTQNLLAGGLNDTFQIGANKDQNIALTIGAMDAKSLGVADTEYATFVSGNGITGVDSVTGDLGTSATVGITINAATGAVTQGSIDGTVAISNAASFSGATDTTFQIKVTAITSTGGTGTVGALQYSTDNGVTWTNATSAGTGAFTLANDVKISIAANTGTDVGDVGSIAMTAKNAELVLENSNTAVGDSVTVNANSTSAVLGDAAAGQTARFTFDFESLAAGDATIIQNEVEAKAAVVDANGNVISNAVTNKGLNVMSQTKANDAISTIDEAMKKVSEERSKLGAYQNRLEHTINNLGTASENLTAAQSGIRDVDMAQEMSNFTKAQILSQAGVAMLAQANQTPQAVLKLLG